MVIEDFTHRTVRDLFWLLYQPSLLTELPTEQPNDKHTLNMVLTDDGVPRWLKDLDKHPTELRAYIAQRNCNRIGIYAEQLLSFYFSHYTRFSLIASNIQIHDKQSTIGELDFIIQENNTGKFIHVEFAVKFYLGHLTAPENIPKNISRFNWQHWVGPNKKDTLAIKMKHLIEHQLPLSQKNITFITLKKLAINQETLDRKLLLRGRLYFPYNQPIEPASCAYMPNEKYFWLSISALENNQKFLLANNYFCILPRSHWLSPLMPIDIEQTNIDIVNHEKLIACLKNESQQGVTNWHIAESHSQDNWQELRRFFIVL